MACPGFANGGIQEGIGARHAARRAPLSAGAPPPALLIHTREEPGPTGDGGAQTAAPYAHAHARGLIARPKGVDLESIERGVVRSRLTSR